MISTASKPELVDEYVISPARNPVVPKHVAKHLVSGTSTLGLGVAVERGFGFLANVLAARMGGVATFGAYSLAISTANNISTYAAGGIGSTAVRFSGKYGRNSAGYATLSKVLLIVSVVSASLAALGLWAGAAPIAHLLHKQTLTGLLRWAALSAAGMILLECCRGFFVGQRRLAGLLLLSLAVGAGMITMLPITSHFGPIPMICSQGGVTVGAVALCLLLYRPLGLAASPTTSLSSEPLVPMLKEVWSFGLIQLAGLIGSNAAGWWLTTLIARSDTTMVQMGFFAIANQLRNIVGLAPSLLTESSLAVMAQSEEDVQKTPDQVMALCTFATTFASLLLAGVGIAVVPWALSLLYGKSYAAAASVAAVALATAVVHMGNAPAAARLSIVSIRLTGLINTQWAVLVAFAGTALLFHEGNAWKGAAIFLAAHVVSAVLVLVALNRRGCVPPGMGAVFTMGTGLSVVLAALGVIRYLFPEHTSLVTGLIIAILLSGLSGLVIVGRRHHWVPSFHFLRAILRSKFSRTQVVETPTSGGFDA